MEWAALHFAPRLENMHRTKWLVRTFLKGELWPLRDFIVGMASLPELRVSALAKPGRYETALETPAIQTTSSSKVQGIHSTADAARKQMEQAGFSPGRA